MDTLNVILESQEATQLLSIVIESFVLYFIYE